MNCRSVGYPMFDYHPGGMLMQGRNFAVDDYRFGFNSQEKVDEVAGIGKHNSALFWEYDTRLVRRWNLDPKPNSSFSNYLVFANNPIFYSDLLGDTIGFNSPDEFHEVIANAIGNSEFAKKVNDLRKSDNNYVFNNNHLESGALGGIVNDDNCNFQINYSTDSRPGPEQGQSPFHSLYEETFHATQFENNEPGISFNPTTGIMVQLVSRAPEIEGAAWQWAAINAPGSKQSVTWTHPQAGEVITNQPLIKQMQSATVEQIGAWLFGGYKIPVTEIKTGDKGIITYPPIYQK